MKTITLKVKKTPSRLVLENDKGMRWVFGKIVSPNFALSMLSYETLKQGFEYCSDFYSEFEIQLVIKKKKDLIP